MVKVVDIIRTIDAVLQVDGFDDYGPNGLQVPGLAEVDRVATGVSATRALLERAVEIRAGLVLVHHGLFWNGDAPGLTSHTAERLRVLLKHDIGLAAYHLPLDAHPEHGNNALLAEALGCERHEAFAGTVGRVGIFAGDGITGPELVERVRAATGGREPLHFAGGPARIRTIGLVSGGAASNLGSAVAAGLDAFLTGEPREPVMGEAMEAGIHFIAAGHYATETFGIRRIGELVAQEFGVDHWWIDLPNPV
jgi:dinuclear metal center YbgI/SA1388 family protein